MTDKFYMINRRCVVGGMLAFGGGVVSQPVSAIAATDNPFSIKQHVANPDGFYVNSYLLVGEKSITLVDAQLNEIEAQRIVDLIKSTGKPLEHIIITHTHPDHIMGLPTIGKAFPDAKIHSSPRSIDIIRKTAAHWKGFHNPTSPLLSGQFNFSGIAMECALMPDAESIAPLVLFLPDSKTLVAGDHVLNGQHLWLAEGRADNWLQNIADIKTRWPIATVLPGHGEMGGTELLDITQTYIERFKQAVGAKDRPTAKQQMLKHYSDWVFETALNTSLAVYKG